jgi:hypothetical protein
MMGGFFPVYKSMLNGLPPGTHRFTKKAVDGLKYKDIPPLEEAVM